MRRYWWWADAAFARKATFRLFRSWRNCWVGIGRSRALWFEKGWAGNDRQIGLSGRTVRPRLIITCGVSGAIQFTACMNASEHIVAINTDRTAPIFETAHVAIVGDLYDTILC